MQPPLDAHSDARITFVGHATTIVELSGTRILTDPLLRHRFCHLRRYSPFADVEVDPSTIDVVTLSHMHFDHMDYPSLRMIPSDVPIVTPVGGARYLRNKVDHDIVELRVGDSLRVGEVDIHATPAQHDSRCYWPLWFSQAVLSYMFMGSQTVYFVGDSALFDHMRELGQQYRIDTALLPIWGYGPYLRGDHMNPADAARALAMLLPRVAVPIHWGTYHPVGWWWKRMSYLWRPPHAFALEASRNAPETDVRILMPGDTTIVTGIASGHRRHPVPAQAGVLQPAFA